MTAGRRYVLATPRRPELITLERFTTTTDEYGEEKQAWGPIGTEWALIFYGRGDERRQAAMEQGKQSVTFQVRADSLTRSITLEDRIALGGSTYDIVSIAPDTPKRGKIEFTATRAL